MLSSLRSAGAGKPARTQATGHRLLFAELAHDPELVIAAREPLFGRKRLDRREGFGKMLAQGLGHLSMIGVRAASRLRDYVVDQPEL